MIDGLTKYILDQLHPTLEDNDPSPAWQPSPERASSPTLHALELLPNEIIFRISSFLPFSAVLNLHRSSKTLALKLPIDQSLCRDRLISGDLIDYLWDLDTAECFKKDKEGSWDWKALVQKLKQAKILKTALGVSLTRTMMGLDMTVFEQSCLEETDFEDAPIGLQNRCRIARIVKDIEKMDRIEAEDPVVDGEKQRHLGLLWA